MTLEQLEEVYMNGLADDVTGDVDAPTDHVYRVGNQLVFTTTTGAHDVMTYGTEADAIAVFADIDAEYSEWMGDIDA